MAINKDFCKKNKSLLISNKSKMKGVFEKPLILDGENDNVVLIYSNYIIGDITKDNADLSVERINNALFNPLDFELIIDVKSVFEYELELDIDTQIMFGVKKESGTSYENIGFKDTETAKEAERLIKDQFENLGLSRKEGKMTPISAAKLPLIITGIVTVVGGLLTWMAFEFHNYEPTRTKVVKWYVYLMVKISKMVGHLPFLILTVVITIFCLYWMTKRIMNPPYKVVASK